ncbi:MAG: cytochrome c3 family protein [Vicinamibacterales bacterium]
MDGRLYRNAVTLAGATLTTVAALLFLAFFALDLIGMHAENPYIGILAFIALPTLFVVGLLLMPFGLWLERRRRARGQAPSLAEWPRIDFNAPRTRIVAFTVLVLTPVNVLIVSMAGYKGVEAMDSVAFCGQTCHEVMQPEFVAYQHGPHARVKCVECHIGPGAGWFVKSKLSGTRQVFAVLLNSHPRPIPSPVHDLRPARETCEQCHWPAKFHGDKIETRTEFADDEANSASVTTLRLRIGGIDGRGQPTGIHWHVSDQNAIEYVALDDARQEIGLVRLTAPDGTVTEFRAEGVTDEQLAAGQSRRMDCVDCHNRPSHRFARSVGRAVDEVLASGAAANDLPFLKREAVAALEPAYPTQDAGVEAIGGRLTAFYRDGYPELFSSRRGDVDRAVAAVQAAYARNIFPAMKVGWGQHADNLGHTDFPGCFRCHDESHVSPEGRTIRQDCDMCHELSF